MRTERGRSAPRRKLATAEHSAENNRRSAASCAAGRTLSDGVTRAGKFPGQVLQAVWTLERSGDCLLVSRGGDQDLREECPGGVIGFSLTLLRELARQAVQNRFKRFQEPIQRRVLPLSRPAPGQVRAHLRDHPLGVLP